MKRYYLLAVVIIALAATISLWWYGRSRAAHWIPPSTRIPDEVVDATRVLFENGAADPRDGVFRKVTILADRHWHADGEPLTTTGWVLTRGGKVSCAVCWDGLAYSPIQVGEKIGLSEYVTEKMTPSWISMGNLWSDLGYPADSSTSLMGVALLLRVGNGQLAGTVYDALGWDEPHREADRMLRGYVSTRYRRAVLAHIRGDFAMAAGDAQTLLAGRVAFYDADARWRRASYGGGAEQADLVPADTQALADDSSRRIGRRAPTAAALSSITKLPAQQRIPRLIDLLDEVSAQQQMEPGDVDLTKDPIVHALIATGAAAVEPLIDCAQNDKRFTRSYRLGSRSDFAGRIIGVREAAAAAIKSILHKDELPMTADYEVDCDALRKQWRELNGRAPAALPSSGQRDPAPRRLRR